MLRFTVSIFVAAGAAVACQPQTGIDSGDSSSTDESTSSSVEDGSSSSSSIDDTSSSTGTASGGGAAYWDLLRWDQNNWQ